GVGALHVVVDVAVGRDRIRLRRLGLRRGRGGDGGLFGRGLLVGRGVLALVRGVRGLVGDRGIDGLRERGEIRGDLLILRVVGVVVGLLGGHGGIHGRLDLRQRVGDGLVGVGLGRSLGRGRRLLLGAGRRW